MARYENKPSSIIGAVEEALSTAEELRDELQDWYDNLPESFQSGQKGDELQEAISQLEEVISNLEDAQNSEVEILNEYSFEYQQVVYPRSEYMSRRKRLDQAAAALQGVPTEIPDDLEISEDDQDDAQQLLDSVAEAISNIESVEFPSR